MSQCTVVTCEKEARWKGTLSIGDSENVPPIHVHPVGYCDEHLLFIANGMVEYGYAKSGMTLDMASAF